jgi:hypothetical protein
VDLEPLNPPAAPRDRWYVLAVLTVVYSLNIADRFSISTLIEPIREELRLSDSGMAQPPRKGGDCRFARTATWVADPSP